MYILAIHLTIPILDFLISHIRSPKGIENISVKKNIARVANIPDESCLTISTSLSPNEALVVLVLSRRYALSVPSSPRHTLSVSPHFSAILSNVPSASISLRLV